MNRRQKRMFGIIVVAAVLGFLFWQFKQKTVREQAEAAAEARRIEEARLAAEAAKVKVTYIVPNEPIPPRTTVTDRMIRVVEVEKANAPWKDETDEGKYCKKITDVIGRIALVRLGVGEPLRKERLAAKDDLRAISFLIEPGQRAVTIKMDLTRGVGGFIRQGDYVDILGTFVSPTGAGSVTKAILRRVKILIVDRTYRKERRPGEEVEEEEPEEGEEKDQEGGKNPNRALKNLGMVTFQLPPADAEKLILANNRIQLTLALRNPGDPVEEEDNSEVIRDIDVFTDGTETAAPPPVPQGEVELILGSKKDVRTVGVQ